MTRNSDATGQRVDSLIAKVDATDQRVENLVVKIDESKRRFELLRLEAQHNREEFRQSWNDAVTRMECDRVEARNQANSDRPEHTRRFDAQQEIIQCLLEIVDLSRNNNRLRDHVDTLGQAS